MKYQTPTAFRTALEARLLQQSRDRNVSLTRIRKLVVFERLLARLLLVASEKWTVKGGVALILRIGDDARTTRDLDLARQGHVNSAIDDMMAVESLHLNDYFSFTVTRTADLDAADKGTIARFRALAELDGRRFEQVTIDVGFDDSFEDLPDRLSSRSLLEFAGLPPIEIPALPLERHIAEKLHAYSRTYEGNRTNTRVRDLIDIILIASFAELRTGSLRRAIQSTFAGRSTGYLPASMPPPPTSWRPQYQQLASEVDLDPDVQVGYRQAAAFLDPILQGDVDAEAMWDPTAWKWQKTVNPLGRGCLP